MTLQDEQFLETWDSPADRCVETEINRLEDALDELTDAAKHRDGTHSIRANSHRLKNALVKLHDIYVATMPVTRSVA